MTADDLDIDDIQRTLLCNADIPCGRLTMGDVWHDIKALALVAEVGSLRADNATLRDLLAKALPWVDPNESDDGHLLTVAITDALGDHRG